MVPKAGPLRITTTMTAGRRVRVMAARASSFRQKPGPEVEVITRPPAAEAPMTMFMAAISLSACRKSPPLGGSSREKYSGISLWGVMG